MSPDPLQVRPLAAGDPVAMQLAERAGAHGIYVRNALAQGEHDGLVFELDGAAVALAWFGARGNLVLIERCHGDAPGARGYAIEALAGHVRRVRRAWRIVLGDSATVAALADDRRPCLAHRTQIYYQGDSRTANAALVRDDVRHPTRADRERLARATLSLNDSDLNIPPARVDRSWLYDTIDERIENGTTWCLGPVGQLWSKLDHGSCGPAGNVLEGVFTFPERRGRGLGSELVATTLAREPVGCALHVAADNFAARRAYERAGMSECGSCSLLLFG